MLENRFDEVLAAAQSGDGAAFAELWRDIQPVLLRYLRVLSSEPDDIASETWLQVVRGLDAFQGSEPAFRGWLLTIARNKAIDQHRRAGRRPEVPVAQQASEAVGQVAPDTADLALDRISTETAVALIARLPKDQAEIIMLRVVAGLDVAAVAKITRRQPGAVRVAAHRGLARLARLLGSPAVTP
jgi:RNA polymerase sigma-70 factor (ECF subfamily)